jgi:hypothetical protein
MSSSNKVTTKDTVKEVKINVPESVQVGKFSNIAQIHATETEIVFDFAYVAPNSNEGTLASRIILTPKHAQSFSEALQKLVVQTYEKKEGK